MSDVSGFRVMWSMAMFDMPVGTKSERKAATKFRKGLLNDGYFRLQYSVYARPCLTREVLVRTERRVKRNLPPTGNIRLLAFTDVQFGRMEVFNNQVTQSTEPQLNQLEIW